jgi:hypothetical protein
MTCNEEDIYIIGSLKNIFRLLYEYYFSNIRKGNNDPVLKRFFKFLKDFDISPLLIS